MSETNPAFAPVDILKDELEIDSSIYEGFKAAIMVKGKPRMVALFREYADAVQVMAAISAAAAPQPAPAAEKGDVRERLARLIYDFLDERFPENSMPGQSQLFADPGDTIDADMKHEAGCFALADAILASLSVDGR